MMRGRPPEIGQGSTLMKRFACGAAALLVLSAFAHAQKDKDVKQPPKDKDKAPVKVEEPRAVTALRTAGAVFERDKNRAITGVILFGTKAGDADLVNVAELKTV